MNDIAWQTEHSVETIANQRFAWTYMTDVTNWDDPPAQFRLEGSFVTGGRGRTEMPGQAPRNWQLRDVRPIECYTIELSLDGAVLSFVWRFHALSDGRTRLTQRITLEGESASSYVAQMQQTFGCSLAPGMRKVAAAIDKALTAQY